MGNHSILLKNSIIFFIFRTFLLRFFLSLTVYSISDNKISVKCYYYISIVYTLYHFDTVQCIILTQWYIYSAVALVVLARRIVLLRLRANSNFLHSKPVRQLICSIGVKYPGNISLYNRATRDRWINRAIWMRKRSLDQ